MTISTPRDSPRRAVLGIDAAWTAHHPSGVALAVQDGACWRLAGLWPSYSDFTGGGSAADDLIAACLHHCGRAPDLVAVDMPLSLDPIVGRRVSDNAVSRAYGGRGAGTHSPSASRPGPIADDLRRGFVDLGYGLRTEACPDGRLAEVYPHPALIELTGASRRLPYKVGRIGAYWRDLAPAQRRVALMRVWRDVLDHLQAALPGSDAALPLPPPDARLATLKATEDQLDAIICALAGIRILSGAAQAYGDARSAIWVPKFAGARLG